MQARVLMLTAATLVTVSSCSPSVGGQPAPDPGNSSTSKSPSSVSNSELPSNGAPKVLHPLDSATLSRIQSDPCGALTDAQLEKIGLLGPGDGRAGEFGPICFWDNEETGASTSVSYPIEAISKGLSQIYDGHVETYRKGYFLPIPTIDGYPAIASEPNDQRKLGSCSVQVGITDQKIVSIGVTVSEEKQGKIDPCGPAAQVAHMVMATIAGGA